MSDVLCIRCDQKFDDRESFTVREFMVPGYLTKSHHDEVVPFHRPICPECGAEDGLLSIGRLPPEESVIVPKSHQGITPRLNSLARPRNDYESAITVSAKQ